MRTAEEILKSLIADIEAMQHRANVENCEIDEYFFGPFSESSYDDDYGCSVEWPNLAILLQEAKGYFKDIEQDKEVSSDG